MNKTWKTILQIAGYIIAALLGAAGEAVMRSKTNTNLTNLTNNPSTEKIRVIREIRVQKKFCVQRHYGKHAL